VSWQARRPARAADCQDHAHIIFDRQHGVAGRIGGALPDQHDGEVIAAAWITVLSHSPAAR
jgi:hypothetical protein